MEEDGQLTRGCRERDIVYKKKTKTSSIIKISDLIYCIESIIKSTCLPLFVSVRMGQNVIRSFGPQNFYGRSKFVLKLDHPWVNALNGEPRHLALSFILLSLLLNFTGGIEIAIDIDPRVFFIFTKLDYWWFRCGGVYS